jgi:DNA-binding IclR family transcriptional regulator
MTPDADGAKTINSVDNAVHILDELLVRETAGVTELGEAVGLSKATVHHYLTTLRRHGFVQQVDGTYRLGLRPLSYGGAAREREAVFQSGKEGVDRLAATTGETARLVVERNGYAVTLYQSSERPLDEIPTTLGTREDLHSTAAGKAMLAALDDSSLDAFLERGELTRHTQNTIVDPATLRAEIADVRSQGIAFDDNEQFEGVRCVSTALVTDAGGLLGALSVSSSTANLPDEAFEEEFPQALQNVAGVIEINTAYRGWVE